MSEIYIEEFSDALVKMLEGEECNPYEVGYVSNVAARKVNAKSIEMSWYANVHTRFHEVSIALPFDRIKACVSCWKYDIKPYVFVDQNYIEELYTSEYVVFCLVDAIGVKQAIKNGELCLDQLLALRSNIDTLAEKYGQVTFVSFADSLLLKSNWAPGYFVKDIECTYEPELFLEIVRELEKIYREVLGLEIYAVLAQGDNEYRGESALHRSDSGNHICLNSLGVPFAELLAIESAARLAIRNGVHEPAQLYMDEQYYHSLRLEYKFDKSNKPKNSYSAIMKPYDSFYFYNSANNLLAHIRDE